MIACKMEGSIYCFDISRDYNNILRLESEGSEIRRKMAGWRRLCVCLQLMMVLILRPELLLVEGYIERLANKGALNGYCSKSLVTSHSHSSNLTSCLTNYNEILYVFSLHGFGRGVHAVEQCVSERDI